MSGDALVELADEMDRARSAFLERLGQTPIELLQEEAERIGRGWSGSSLGYHANVYYEGLTEPPAGAHFDSEWGMQRSFAGRTSGSWVEYTPAEVRDEIFARAGNPDLKELEVVTEGLRWRFSEVKAEALSMLSIEKAGGGDAFLETIGDQIEEVNLSTSQDIREILVPRRQVMTRDTLAAGGGFRVAPHQAVLADVAAIKQFSGRLAELSRLLRQAGSHILRLDRSRRRSALVGTNVFIGHGRSSAWRELKDFISDRLGLPYDEFNRVPVAGVTNIARLSEMLDSAALALIVLTAEDELADGGMLARQNVVHEAGLFQGKLGFTKAIVLLEDGCEEFSNIQGLGQIRFPKGKIGAAFEEVRRVLERESLVGA